MTKVYLPMESVKAKEVDLFFKKMPDERDFVVIGRLDLIGNKFNQMKKGVRKYAAKMGADAAIVMAQTEGSSDYFSLGYVKSKSYMGSKDNRNYYLVRYKLPGNSRVGYVRWLSYAVSYKTDNVDVSLLPKTLFEFDKVGLFESAKRKLSAEKKLGARDISRQEKEELKESIESVQVELDQLGFNELNDFEQEVVLLRGARLAGVKIVDTSPEGRQE